MFLKNKNIIFKIRRSKVTDYAALTELFHLNDANEQYGLNLSQLFYPNYLKNVLVLNVLSTVPDCSCEVRLFLTC